MTQRGHEGAQIFIERIGIGTIGDRDLHCRPACRIERGYARHILVANALAAGRMGYIAVPILGLGANLQVFGGYGVQYSVIDRGMKRPTGMSVDPVKASGDRRRGGGRWGGVVTRI